MRRQANGKLEFTSTGQAFIDVTTTLRGLDDFLNAITPLLATPDGDPTASDTDH